MLDDNDDDEKKDGLKGFAGGGDVAVVEGTDDRGAKYFIIVMRCQPGIPC